MFKRYTLFIFLLIFLFSIQNTFAQYSGTGSNSKTVWVKPYIKSDGTFVQGHYRTKANDYNLDNFNAKGNYNPYTGKVGTKEYSSPYNSLKKSESSYQIDYNDLLESYDSYTPSYNYEAPSYDFTTPSYDYTTPSYDYTTPSYDFQTPSYNFEYKLK